MRWILTSEWPHVAWHQVCISYSFGWRVAGCRKLLDRGASLRLNNEFAASFDGRRRFFAEVREPAHAIRYAVQPTASYRGWSNRRGRNQFRWSGGSASHGDR